MRSLFIISPMEKTMILAESLFHNIGPLYKMT